MRRLILTALPDLPTVAPGDDLCGLLADALQRAEIAPHAGDVLVLAQKIVSKAEGRFVDLGEISPSAEARRLGEVTGKDPRLVEVILGQSSEVLRAVPGVLIVRHSLGMVMANAGIDASNVEAGGRERVLLLPLDPDASAGRLRGELRTRVGVDMGIIINDSFGRAWRIGTTGTAIGVSGLPAVLDLRGTQDRNGRTLIATEVGHADEIAAAASLVMGQGAEGQPAVHVRGLPPPASEGRAADLVRPLQMDLFR
jgi:coenzyme F420-0:L-glutamate ligase/coenzyme F420-1:gamma-L-glutamate ligase